MAAKSQAGRSPAPAPTTRFAALERMAKARPAHDSLEWVLVSPRKIMTLLAYAQACGDACMFGQTRDGSALIITVYSGQERHPYYAGGVPDMEAILDGIILAMQPDIPSPVCERVDELLRVL